MSNRGIEVGSIHHELQKLENNPRSRQESIQTVDAEECFITLSDGRRVFDFESIEPDEDGHLDIDFQGLLNLRNDLEIQSRQEKSDKKITRIVELMERLPEEAALRIFERIKNETNFLHTYEEINLYAYITSDFPDERDASDPDRYRSDKIFERRKKAQMPFDIYYDRVADDVEKGELNGGTYNRVTSDERYVLLAGSHPSPTKIIKTLLLEGDFPIVIRTLAHETIHHFQYPEKLSLADILQAIALRLIGRRSKQELKEIHARVQGNKPGSKTETVKEILEAKKKKSTLFGLESMVPLYPGLDIDKLISSVEVIDQLDALGFSPPEIGQLIQNPGTWDKDGARYKNMRAAVERKILDLGIDEYDLENLVQAHHLEQEIDSLRARIIAQEEIGKALAPVIEKSGGMDALLQKLEEENQEKEEYKKLWERFKNEVVIPLLKCVTDMAGKGVVNISDAEDVISNVFWNGWKRSKKEGSSEYADVCLSVSTAWFEKRLKDILLQNKGAKVLPHLKNIMEEAVRLLEKSRQV